jgi:serine/threonine protein phosphatase 1
MTSTWFLGDIHGCAEELAELLERIEGGPGTRIISLGDLYHRGPDPHGVAQLLSARDDVELVFGNHELVLLRRSGMVPVGPDGKIQVLDEGAGGYDADDLRGDGGTVLRNIDPERSIELLRFLERGVFCMRGEAEQGPFRGQPWLAVHAGIIPGQVPEQTPPMELTHVRQIGRWRKRYWYENYDGPEMVIFGHTTFQVPRRQEAHGRLVAHGLDTACVYGGCLTAWRLEDDEYEVVPAKKAWARELRD